jgi:predicted nucleic acid-binding Zn ribbon protein
MPVIRVYLPPTDVSRYSSPARQQTASVACGAKRGTAIKPEWVGADAFKEGVMSLHEPRCLVCGAPLNSGAPFEKDPRKSETCSYECAEIYFHNEDESEQEAQ